MLNSVTASASKNHGENESAVVGADIAVIVSDRKNDTNVFVKNNSNLLAKTINIDTLNELPGNHGFIGITNSLLSLGVNINSDANDDLSADFAKITEGQGLGIVPTFGLHGLFNNFVAAGSSGDSAGISASVSYMD